jgi:hypothetical protein
MTSRGRPVLEDAEAERRRLLLARLQSVFLELGIECMLARNHKLVLRYSDGAAGPNGLTDPALWVFLPSGTVTITTDGADYQLDDSREFPVADTSAAAAAICQSCASRGQPAQAR